MAYGTLYIVATPIGNLKDITLRAIEALKEVDLIASEDTRQTIKLLNHYGINKKLVSNYQQNQENRSPYLIEELKQGKNIALVSDSGTPGISDPGLVLVKKAIAHNIPVVSLPGPCALISALVSSGLPADGFVFLGFLPRREIRIKRALEKAFLAERTVIFYESPYRVKDTLEFIKNNFPDAQKMEAAVARELTKKFEQLIRGTLEEVLHALGEAPVKGEVVVLLKKMETHSASADSAEAAAD